MMRNDYRRSLILLRSDAEGYSGHVRLERRTLMGTMYFLLQAGEPCPALRVALVGRGRDGRYYACAVGETRRDGRGQAVLSYSFDPRNVCGRELEQYQLIAVTRAGDDDCRVLLRGNVCGHAELDDAQVRAALRSLYAGSSPDDQPGAPSVTDPVTSVTLPENHVTDSAENVTVVADAGQAHAPMVNISVTESAQSAGDDATDTTPAVDSGSVEGEVLANREASPSAANELSSEVDGGGASLPSARALLEARGVSCGEPWPQDAEPLRALFARESALSEAPDDDCVYVAAPLPEGCGFPYAAAGLRAQGGRLVSLRYALPAAWTKEPPAGLEDYAWVGGQNRGWWVVELPVEG